jgi:hypothetical protein
MEAHMLTSSTGIAILVVVILVVVILLALVFSRRRRTEGLRGRFGPEYDRAVKDSGNRGSAESELQARGERVDHLNTHDLSPEARARFIEAWRALEARFVDDPSGAVTEADRLIGEAMQARGYPVTDFAQRVTDLSATYPQLVDDYRLMHETAMRSQRGEATTEELRKGLVACRTLIGELVGAPDLEQRKVV